MSQHSLTPEFEAEMWGRIGRARPGLWVRPAPPDMADIVFGSPSGEAVGFATIKGTTVIYLGVSHKFGLLAGRAALALGETLYRMNPRVEEWLGRGGLTESARRAVEHFYRRKRQ